MSYTDMPIMSYTDMPIMSYTDMPFMSYTGARAPRWVASANLRIATWWVNFISRLLDGLKEFKLA
jgi:hypothetical protein